jgi:hypothetical protein
MNKKTAYHLLIGLLYCSMISCEIAESGSPEASMSGFIECMKQQDFQKAKDYTSQNTDAILDFMDTRIQMLEQMGKSDETASLFGGIDFNNVSVECTRSEKTAICTCCALKTDDCSEIQLLQRSGKWLIDMPKESSTTN